MEQFLKSLLEPTVLSGVVEVLLGVALSFVADWKPLGFTELSARAKRLYWLIVPIVIPVVAVVVLSWNTLTVETIFGAVQVGVLVFLGSQVAHTRQLQ